jgi:hypothetical protein
MMAEAGVIPKVIGKSSEMAPTGPIPGRTPISVPVKTPIKQYKRLVADRATPQPKMRFAKTSDIE